MSLFRLGAVTPLLVQNFDGFDRPNTAQLVALLGTTTSTGDQVLQQGSTPWLQAGISGTVLSEADVATLRGYYLTREPVRFVDGNGNATDVRVLEFKATDHTDWWEFTAQLLESDVAAAGEG